MKRALVNQCGALVIILGSLLMGVAMGESLASDFQHSTNKQMHSNFRPRERKLATTLVWCIARSNVSDVDLQNALDWVCGPLPGQGQVNCGPISSGGACFDPDTTPHHSSYAFNEYFQQSNASLSACDFSGNAVITNIDPSQGTCEFAGSSVTVDSNLTNIIGAAPPESSPVSAPVPPPQESASVLSFEPNYLFCMSTVVTLISILFNQS